MEKNQATIEASFLTSDHSQPDNGHVTGVSWGPALTHDGETALGENNPLNEELESSKQDLAQLKENLKKIESDQIEMETPLNQNSEVYLMSSNSDSKSRIGNDEAIGVDFFGQPIRSPASYTVKNEIFEFMDKTTIHSLGDIVRQNSIPLRIFLVICFTASVAACTWQIVVAITTYLTYDIDTTSTSKFEAPTQFPMVTFCNLNSYNMENADTVINDYATTIHPDNYETANEYVAALNQHFIYETIKSNADSSNKFSDTCKLSDENYYNYDDLTESNWTDVEYCQSNPGSGFSNQDLGFDIKQMLISCRFQDNKCSADDFIFYYDYYYGNCYRFNSGKNSNGTTKAILNSGTPGWRHGLQLELYTGSRLRQEKYALTRGFRILALNKTFTQQKIEDFGVDVSVGQATNIVVRRTVINHMGAPYGNCLDNDISNINWNQNDVLQFMYKYLVDGNVYKNGNWTWKWDVKYSQYNCINMCFQKYVYQTCNCFDVTLPRSEAKSTFIINKACATPENMSCLNNASSNFYSSDSLSGDCYTKCPVECQEQTFELSTSVSQFPTEWYASVLNNSTSYNNSINYNMSSLVSYSDDFDSLRDSIALVYIYYPDMIYSQIDESAAMKLLDLISYLGGLTGLFLGASLLSITEPIVVIYNIVYSKARLLVAYYLTKRKNKVRDGSSFDHDANVESGIKLTMSMKSLKNV